MIPTSSFSDMCCEIGNNHNFTKATFVVGILIADVQQQEAKDYIVNYLDRYDINSGKYIDFYIPGYYTVKEKNTNDIKKKYHPLQDIQLYEREGSIPAFKIRRTQEEYYFSRELFEDFLAEIEDKLSIKYTYNPMLILLEVTVDHETNKTKYGNNMIIELDNPNGRREGLKRSGQIMDLIFEVAKKKAGLAKYGDRVRLYFIKQNAFSDLGRVFDGEGFQVINELINGLCSYRVRQIKK